MIDLKKLQHEFLRALKNPASAAGFSKHIKANAKLGKAERLAIYLDSIQENLFTSLLGTFSVCDQLIGRENFRGLANLYIQQTSVTTPDLGEYGASFSDFIANYPPAEVLPYLAEMARFEWECWQTWQQPKTTLLDPARLAQVAAELHEEIIFHLPSPATLFHSIYPVAAVWQLHQTDDFSQANIDWETQCHPALILREDFAEVTLLTQAEWKLLKKIMTKIPLGKFNSAELELLPNLMAKKCLGGFELAIDQSK